MRSRALQWAVYALLIAFLAHLYHSIWSDLAVPSRGIVEASMADFRYTVWSPVRDLLGGHDPYDPLPYIVRRPGNLEFDLYLPAWLGLTLPVALLPFKVAVAAWLVVQTAMILGLGWVLARRLQQAGILGSPILWTAIVALLFASVQPGREGIKLGQPTVLILVGIVLAFLPLADTRWSAAWSVVGVALTLLKPQFGLIVLLILILSGRWRLAAKGGALAAVASLPVLVAVIVDAGGVGSFIDVVRRNLDYSQTVFQTGDFARPEGRADIGLHLAARLDQSPLSFATPVLVVGVALFGAAVLIARRRSVAWTTIHGCVAVVAPLMCLLLLVHQRYDLVTAGLVLPMWYAARRSWGAGSASDRLLLTSAVLSTLALMHPSSLDKLLGPLQPSLSVSGSLDVLALSVALAMGYLALAIAPKATAGLEQGGVLRS